MPFLKYFRKHLLFGIIAVQVLYGRTHALGQSTKPNEYENPILFADYSDPDVIRDGRNYYLIASTFHFFPGIPVLESKDLVHWTIVGHVVPRLELNEKYSLVGGNKYGQGVWAPSIRRHGHLFYVYFPTPEEGIFVSTQPDISKDRGRSRFP